MFIHLCQSSWRPAECRTWRHVLSVRWSWCQPAVDRQRHLDLRHSQNPSCLRLPGTTVIMANGRYHLTHTHTQPFYASLAFVRDNPGEQVPEKTFTHSHISWSSHIVNPWHPPCSIYMLDSLINNSSVSFNDSVRLLAVKSVVTTLTNNSPQLLTYLLTTCKL